MIKDKITPELKSKFQDAINRTKETGREHGFFLCIDEQQKLSTTKLRSGVAHQVRLESPLVACPGKKIQGDFHTHTYLTALKKVKPNLSDEKIKEFINREHKKYIEELGTEKLTIDSPSPKDLLKEILYNCVGVSKGTTCVVSDLEADKVECWTVKNMNGKNCNIAYNKLFKGEKERELVKYDKQMISLFDKEIIDLKE